MTPTNELRFVERKVTDVPGRPYEIRRVLQQKWCASTSIQGALNPYKYEWRDVPLVKDEA